MSRLIRVVGNVSFSIALTVFLLYYAILFTFPNYLLNDPDTFWHIRTGQWILDHKQVPTVDLFSCRLPEIPGFPPNGYPMFSLPPHSSSVDGML